MGWPKGGEKEAGHGRWWCRVVLGGDLPRLMDGQWGLVGGGGGSCRLGAEGEWWRLVGAAGSW